MLGGSIVLADEAASVDGIRPRHEQTAKFCVVVAYPEQVVEVEQYDDEYCAEGGTCDNAKLTPGGVDGAFDERDEGGDETKEEKAEDGGESDETRSLAPLGVVDIAEHGSIHHGMEDSDVIEAYSINNVCDGQDDFADNACQLQQQVGGKEIDGRKQQEERETQEGVGSVVDHIAEEMPVADERQ